MTKKILLINDMAGYGKVALSVMVPILSAMKFEVYNLPTAIVSNTLDYGQFHILDATDHLQETIRVWENLNFHFDVICTGFITSPRQAQIIYDYCLKEKTEHGTMIVVDPIMGDEGVLYPGIANEMVGAMRQLCSISDLAFPNLTEASLITGIPSDEIISIKDLENVVHHLRMIGCRQLVITSCQVNDMTCNLVFTDTSNKPQLISYEQIPVRFPGTGDIFSAVTVGKLLCGSSLQASVITAMKYIESLIIENKDNEDKYKGIPIESYLHILS